MQTLWDLSPRWWGSEHSDRKGGEKCSKERKRQNEVVCVSSFESPVDSGVEVMKRGPRSRENAVMDFLWREYREEIVKSRASWE